MSSKATSCTNSLPRRAMPDLNEGARALLVHRLDPDGHLRDLIDEALRRYDQRSGTDDGAAHPRNERPNDGKPADAAHA